VCEGTISACAYERGATGDGGKRKRQWRVGEEKAVAGEGTTMMEDTRGRGERRRRTGIGTRATRGGDEPAGRRRSVARRSRSN